MYQVEVTSDVNKGEWKNLLLHSPYSTIFHTPEWIKVLTDTFSNYESLYVVVYDSKGQLVGGIPIINDKRYGISNYLSLPFSTYGGPVVLCDDSVRVVNLLLEKFCDIIQFSKGVSWIIDYYGICANCKNMGFKQKGVSTHILNLNNSLEEIWTKSINRKKRNEVRQAQKKGIIVKPVSDFADVRICYEMMLEVSKKHHSRTPPFKLYENIFQIMVSGNMCNWNIAWYNDIPVANSIFFNFNDSIFYWMNSSFQQYNVMRPNDMLIYNMIEWGIENGYSSLNFGSSPAFAQGLLRFKESWGTEQKDYFSYDQRPNYIEFTKMLQNALYSISRRMNI